MSTQGPFLQPCLSVVGGHTFASVIVILFFTLMWHYGITSLVGKAPTSGNEWSSSPGAPFLAHPEIAGP